MQPVPILRFPFFQTQKLMPCLVHKKLSIMFGVSICNFGQGSPCYSPKMDGKVLKFFATTLKGHIRVDFDPKKVQVQ